MKNSALITVIGILSCSNLLTQAEIPTYPNSIWCKEPSLRKAIAETYPGLITRSYHYNNHSMIGILADEKNKRVLCLLYPTLSGTLEITHNNTPLDPAKLSPALIKTKAEHGRIEYLDIGRWIPMSKKDTLSINGDVTWSAEFTFSIKYDPDRDWRSTISEIKIDESKLKKADAYHFSEDSLLDDIRAVLKNKPACRVKLKHNQILAVAPWKEDKDAVLAPMFVKVSDKISINNKEAEEFMTDAVELKNRLDGYVVTAKAGAQNPKIRLRVTPKANDKLFREVLDTIIDLRIFSIQLEEVAK